MQFRKFLLFLAAILACYSPLRAAALDLLQLTPPDSGVIIGINVEQIRGSNIGKAILAQAKGTAPDAQKLFEMMGFDPINDIHEVVLTASSTDPKAHGLFLVRGTFDPKRLLEAGAASGTQNTEFHGVRILTHKSDQQTTAFACLGPSLIVGGEPAMVKSAILRMQQGTKASGELLAKAAEMSATDDIWLVSHITPAKLAAGAPAAAAAQADMLKSITQASGGLKLGTDLVLHADLMTQSPKDAENMASMMRLFIGLAVSNKRDAKQAGALLEKLALKADGNTVKLAFSIPEAEVIKSFQETVQNARKTVEEQAPAPPPSNDIKIYSSPKDMGTITLK